MSNTNLTYSKEQADKFFSLFGIELSVFWSERDGFNVQAFVTRFGTSDKHEPEAASFIRGLIAIN